MSASDKLNSLFTKATLQLQQGKVTSAKKGFIKLTRLAPKSPVVWYNLGLSHQHLNEHPNAIIAYKKTLKLDANSVDAMVNLGASYQLLNQLDSALVQVDRALSKMSNHPRALNLKGSILADQKLFESAKSYFERSLSIDDNNWDTQFNLANVSLELGQYDVTDHYLQKLLARDANNKKARELQAQSYINQKNYPDAGKLLKSLETSYGSDETVMRLGLSLREIGNDHFGVIELSDRLLKRFPRDAGLWNSRGGAYFQVDGIAQSKLSYEKAVSLDPDNHEYLNNIGLVFSSLGNKMDAEESYRKSIAINPEFGEAHKNLAAMKRFTSLDDPDASAVIELWEKQGHSTLNTIKLSFALGKIYDDCGQYERAFEAYKVGNDLKFKDSAIDLEKYLAHIDRVPVVFNQAATEVAPKRQGAAPIFVLGMPRSGTTLVEQIIARHPLVSACGELPCIEKTITRLENQTDPVHIYPDDFTKLSTEVLAQESNEYVNWVRKIHSLDTPYFTDKMPFNFVHIWLIRAMFPSSPIVNCQRHPLDVIISNYFQLFGSDVSFVYHLDALAEYYIRYHNLMQHWQKLFGPKITTICYEQLVTDHQNQVKALISSISLPWDEACLKNSSDDSQAVRTASIWQVRQGIYTRSKERWRHYEKPLKPVADKLVAHGILDSNGKHLIDAQATSD